MESEEKMEKPKNGINKTAISVALILGLSIVGYGYTNISYKNKVFEAEQAEKARERFAEEAEKEKQEKEKKLNKLSLEICLASAFDNYSKSWDDACDKEGKDEGCTLYGNVPKVLEERHERGREECFKKYPVD